MLTRIKKLFCTCTFALLLTAGLYSQEVEEIKIDAGQRLGKISHGATGFLYGLGDPGIPARQLLSALHPVTAAQKAPAGIQHPNGDALEVAEDFFSSGGKQLQVYMQDIYKQWPYEKLGMSDYLPKIKAMVKKGKESTYRNNLAWIPLNEPDVIWYNDSNLLPSFLADWKLCYEAIKEADPSAKVVGPNTTKYGENFFDSFLKFSKENNCLPDIITWHELQDDFYSDWENHYNSYRSLEKKYGIKNLPITINEYARFSGDLAMPGKLVQFISRFENVGVNGCLAYWTTAGSLNDLVTRNTYPTGAWYLYYWYGQMSGKRLMVQNQKLECEGLQALAVLDAEKNQIRTILGGSSKEIKVELQDIGKVLKLQKKGVASLVLKKINSSDLNPSIPPLYFICRKC